MSSDNLNQGQQQMLDTIKNLQRQEKSLYNALEASSVKTNPDYKRQKRFIHKINEIATLRQNIYNTIKNTYEIEYSNVANNRNALVNEIATVKIVENELDNAQKNLHALESQKNDKLRMAEINTYYSQRYEAHTNVMQTIVYICIPILIVGVLMKYEIISSNIAKAIIGLVVGIGLFIIGYKIIDMMRRDNMNYDEYEFPFNPSSVDLDDTSNDADQPTTMDMSFQPSCIGQACCPEGNTNGTKWDDTTNKCVAIESFVGSKCLQGSFDKNNVNIDIFDNNDNVRSFDEKSNNYTKF